MIQHMHWLCHTCKREWLYARRVVPQTTEDQCPTCMSTDIEKVTYTPPFLGGDIPRPGVTVVIPSGANTGADVQHVPGSAPAFEQPNVTLMIDAAGDQDVYGVPV